MVACSHYLPAGVASAWHPDGAVRDPFGIVENQVAAICRLTALVHFWHSGLCRCPRRQQEVGATDQIWLEVLNLQSLRIFLQRFVVKDQFRECIVQTEANYDAMHCCLPSRFVRPLDRSLWKVEKA